MMPLVSTDWLAFRLGRPGLIVVDASVVKTSAGETPVRRPALREFETSGHIAGARYADLLHDFSDPDAKFDFTRPTIDRMQAAAGALGLSADSRIVVYDNANGIWAARLWWLLRSFGHQNVSVLDGGLKKWSSENRPLAFGSTVVKRATFSAREQDGFFVDKADILDVIEGRARAHLVCVLRPAVYAGDEKAYARAGHIPASINLPFADLVNASNNALHSPARLSASLAAQLRHGERIILYCGGGVTAAGTALALAVLGVTNVAIYDGSLAEWSADPSLPLETGLTHSRPFA